MLLQITNKCFENCSHCMASASPDGQHMTNDTFVKTLDFIHRLQPMNVQITGGEPTSHPDFYDMCLEIRKLSVFVFLESNGSFIYDDEKYEKVSDLVKNKMILLQVRTHPKYYPSYEKVWDNPKIKALTNHFFNDAIRLIPFGRAVKNHHDEINWKAKPTCGNMFLMSRQTFSFKDAVRKMELNGFFCKPTISPSGDIHAGETTECVKIGTVTDSLDQLYDSIKNKIPCNKCNLANNIPDMAWNLLKGTQ